MKICIVKAPPKFGTEQIRNQLVGVELPVATKKDFRQFPPKKKDFSSRNSDCHVVLRQKAIDELNSAGKREAAKFLATFSGFYFSVKKELCVRL